MALQKINIGAVPNDGTGDNNRAAWQKVNAAFSEVDALGTGKLDATDPSVTNAREWTASEVSQAEAEAGTATTARKWTAQRVRQAVGAWWNTIGTVFGKTLLASSNAAAARTNLGLGSVDNTSDANKPISTATQTALDATVKRLDIGTSPAQVPAGQHLGKLAYMDELAALRVTLTQPQAIGAVWVERVSDTSINLFMRGSDGIARSTTLTLS